MMMTTTGVHATMSNINMPMRVDVDKYTMGVIASRNRAFLMCTKDGGGGNAARHLSGVLLTAGNVAATASGWHCRYQS